MEKGQKGHLPLKPQPSLPKRRDIRGDSTESTRFLTARSPSLLKLKLCKCCHVPIAWFLVSVLGLSRLGKNPPTQRGNLKGLVLVLRLLFETVSLCNPGWPGLRYVNQLASNPQRSTCLRLPSVLPPAGMSNF